MKKIFIDIYKYQKKLLFFYTVDCLYKVVSNIFFPHIEQTPKKKIKYFFLNKNQENNLFDKHKFGNKLLVDVIVVYKFYIYYRIKNFYFHKVQSFYNN